MYEIYINNRPLRLLATSELENYTKATPQKDSNILIARYTGKVKTLLHYADLLEKASPKVSQVVLHFSDLDQLWKDFTSHYKIVSAAGGIVNLIGTDTYLFIHRRGYLDLPKGKVDPGETIEAAALREVHEETGLQLENFRLKPGKGELHSPPSPLADFSPPSITLHTYRSRKEKRVLKPTYWFQMETVQVGLVPQQEEDIDWARWLTLADALNGPYDFYPSLRCLFN